MLVGRSVACKKYVVAEDEVAAEVVAEVAAEVAAEAAGTKRFMRRRGSS